MRTYLFWALMIVFASIASAQTPQQMDNSLGMKLVLIPSGQFTMGSAPGDLQSDDDEKQFQVSISKPFYMGVTEVTQGQYQKVMGVNPSSFKDPQDNAGSANRPVEQVSWEDAVEFCKRLSMMSDEKQNKRVYRLPTEAQWEYACRAGQKGPFGFDSAPSELGQFAWFANNSGDRPVDSERVWKETKEDLDEYLKVLKANRCRTHAVGQKKPNAWGLHDMHGNVWEWCADWYGDYPKGQATDPAGPQKGTDRVVRGGGFHFQSKDCRSAERLGSFPTNRVDDLGFRVIVVVD